MNNEEVDVLARTIYGEARGEDLPGLEAVANVIMNRLNIAKSKNHEYWWGNSIIGICKKPYQFSCWNADDPNCKKISEVNSKDKIFSICLRIARKAIANLLKDRTMGATHYHNKNLEPYWAKDNIPEVEIGNHLFYKLV